MTQPEILSDANEKYSNGSFPVDTYKFIRGDFRRALAETPKEAPDAV
jgi:hypothetical protein